MVGRVTWVNPPPPIRENTPKVLMLSSRRKESKGEEKGAPTVGRVSEVKGGYWGRGRPEEVEVARG